MKRTRKTDAKTRRILKWALTSAAVAAVIAIAAVFGYNYIFSMQRSLWSQLVQDVTEVTYQGGQVFETYLVKEREILARLGRKLGDSSSAESEVKGILETYSDDDGIFSVVVFGEDADGQTEGRLYFAGSDGCVLLSAEDMEERGYGGYGQTGITEPYCNELTGELTLGYYERVTFTDGAVGIAEKGRRMSNLRKEFSLSFFNDTGFSYIVNSGGDIMVRSTNKNSNRTASNLFDIIGQSGNSERDITDFKENMRDSKSGATRFVFNGEDYVFAFAPVENTDGWYIISVIPDSSIAEHADEILDSTQNFVFIIVAVIAVVIAFVFVMYFYGRRMNAKQTEISFREQLFGILANNTNDVFLMISVPDYSVDYVSPNAERVTGIPSADIKNNIRILEEDYDGYNVGYGDIRSLRENGVMTCEHERVHKKTGEPKRFTETVYRVSIDGKDKLIAVLSDRTAEKKGEAALKEAMENAQAANKAKSMFLSNMSHDIRTPMNAIIGFTELIRRDPKDPEKVMQYVNKIYASGQYLLGLINDVLDMSKIESGKVALNLSVINIAEFIEEIAVMMRPQAAAKNQRLNIVTGNIREESLSGDRLRLNQILINILSNAVKYTPEGGEITFCISELPRHNENFARLRFSVKDNGIGMTEEFMQTIFDPFTRETNSTVNKIRGTGLGMAITKNLVDLMGGVIHVESAPGKGSTFTVELELRIDEEDVNNGFWHEYGISRTLVVDDEEDICLNVSGMLAEAGLDSHYARSGEEAVGLIERLHSEDKDFDLVLLDMRMPGMDGIETARRIRQIVPKDISILILTSYDWSELEEVAKDAGIDSFLPKPFFMSNLKLNIKKLKEAKETSPENADADLSLKGKRFLVAEDNALNAEILTELLAVSGAVCDVAVNGKEAVDMFSRSAAGEYDAVLMDIQMPVMNGYEAARAIRSCKRPDACSIPIVAMTANAFAEDINNALEAGMDAHVAKPVDMKYLEKVLKELLNKKGGGK